MYFRLDQIFDPDRVSGDYVQCLSESQRSEKIAVLSKRDLLVLLVKCSWYFFIYGVWLIFYCNSTLS